MLITGFAMWCETGGLFERADGVDHVSGVGEDRRVLAPRGVVGIG